MEKEILCTDWEKVNKDDFYLVDENFIEEEKRKELIEKAKKKDLYYGYITTALSYCIYGSSDGTLVYIDDDMNILAILEHTPIIHNKKAIIEHIS